MRYYVVHNPKSGRHDSDASATLLAQAFKESGLDVEFIPIDAAPSLSGRAQIGARAAKRNHGALIAAGGDGTINCVAAAALHEDALFGAIPLGTFNYFGREHGIPLEPAAAVRALLNAAVETQQVGWVNERLFLINASLGIYATLQEEREADKRRFGRSRLVAILSGLKSLLTEPRKLKLEIQSNGDTQLISTPSLFVANSHLQMGRVGLVARQLDSLERGQLVAIVLKPASTAALFGLAMFGALGRLSADENVLSFSFRQLLVRPRRERQLKVSADGEVALMRTPLAFKVGPHALKLLKPAADERAPIQ